MRQLERRIIQIKEDLCTGCGECVKVCPYADLGLMNGKAYLLREEYCNGFGECIPVCPHEAIYFFIEEAQPFNQAAAERHAAQVRPKHLLYPRTAKRAAAETQQMPNRHKTWPVQLSLVPHDAAFIDNADILLSASCAPFVRDSFQHDFMDGRVVLVACPKLDREDYARSLEDLLKEHDVRSITVVRMEEPSCSGLEYAANRAVERSGKTVPIEIVTLSSTGETISDAKS